MLLSHKTSIKVNSVYSNYIGHMCYAAYKLWNTCNYERIHYKELALPEGVNYPDWYYQKAYHKNGLWYKQLPAQSSQEVCKLLDKAWKSFYKLQKTGKIENPNPPRFKHNPMAITYMQMGIVHDKGSSSVRLSLSRTFKRYMSDTYGTRIEFIYLENKLFKGMDVIKQIKIYPPVKGKCDIIVVYEVQDVKPFADNNKYLSIDLGIHNFITCMNSSTGENFIVGRKYLALCNYYAKEISRVQGQWYLQQSSRGIKYPKSSKHINRLYKNRNNAILDYLHKITRYVVSYCRDNDIHTLVIGDITNIRKGKDYGNITNQKLHALPYKKLYIMLKYKCELEGIRFVMQKEAYSSQCSPFASEVSSKYANPSSRVHRGLYKDNGCVFNADAVGAYNILRLYLARQNKKVDIIPSEIKPTYVTKVAV